MHARLSKGPHLRRQVSCFDDGQQQAAHGSLSLPPVSKPGHVASCGSPLSPPSTTITVSLHISCCDTSELSVHPGTQSSLAAEASH